MSLLVSKYKMIGMLLNVVHAQVQNANKNITKKSFELHNHSTLLTMSRIIEPAWLL